MVTPGSHKLSSNLPKLTVPSVAPVHDTVATDGFRGPQCREAPFSDSDIMMSDHAEGMLATLVHTARSTIK